MTNKDWTEYMKKKLGTDEAGVSEYMAKMSAQRKNKVGGFKNLDLARKAGKMKHGKNKNNQPA